MSEMEEKELRREAEKDPTIWRRIDERSVCGCCKRPSKLSVLVELYVESAMGRGTLTAVICPSCVERMSLCVAS